MATIQQARRAVVGLPYAYDIGQCRYYSKFLDTILEGEKITK